MLSFAVEGVEVAPDVLKKIRRAFQDDTLSVVASADFAVAPGPISPDHIVYAKSYPLKGKPTPETVAAYIASYGYNPKILIWNQQIYAVDSSDKNAALALELAQDGAFVKQLAQAFGGIEYMTEQARAFIENWEAESYRSKQL